MFHRSTLAARFAQAPSIRFPTPISDCSNRRLLWPLPFQRLFFCAKKMTGHAAPILERPGRYGRKM
jgi:hypothetical protein